MRCSSRSQTSHKALSCVQDALRAWANAGNVNLPREYDTYYNERLGFVPKGDFPVPLWRESKKAVRPCRMHACHQPCSRPVQWAAAHTCESGPRVHATVLKSIFARARSFKILIAQISRCASCLVTSLTAKRTKHNLIELPKRWLPVVS